MTEQQHAEHVERVERQRIEFTDAVKRRLVAILCAVLIAVGLAVTNVIYVNHVHDEAARRDAQIRHESDQRWCDLLGAYVEAYREQAPATELGRDIAVKIEKLWREFGCE